MIAFLHGPVIALEEDSCVVRTASGVGYEVFLPSHVRSAITERGQEVELYVSTVVREDALDLYGFGSWDERQTFAILLTISKIGPKLALAVLSRFRPEELRQAVLNEDVGALTQVPGIGKKSAQHMLLELRYKLKSSGSKGALPPAGLPASAFRDSLTGLTNLGYQEEEARPVLEQLFKDEPDLDVSTALRQALKAMARGRA